MEQNPFLQDTTSSTEANPFLDTPKASRDTSTNPGNIKVSPYSASLGAQGDKGSIATFKSYDEGRTALDKLLTEGKQYKDKSVADWIGIYAPASDNNNPAAYRKALEQKGVPINKIYSQMSPAEKEVTLNSLEEYEKGKKVNPFLRDSTPAKDVNPFLDVQDEDVNPFLDTKPTAAPKGPQRVPGAVETFGEHAIFGIPVSAAAYAGMTGGVAVGEEVGLALAPITMGTSTVLGPIIGGALGMFGSGYAADKLARAVSPQALNNIMDAGARAHPYAALSGDIASYIPVGGIGLPKTIVTEAGKTISVGKQVAILTTGGAGFEAAREKVMGEELDPVKIGINALAMPLMAGEPTKLGKAVTFEKLRSTESTELLSDLQKKIANTTYEDRYNHHLNEQKNMESFEDYKRKQTLQGDLFDDPSLKKTEAQLKDEYNLNIRNRAEEQLFAENPELNRPDVGVPKLPKDKTDMEGMRNYFYNLMGAETQDKIIADHIIKFATKDNLSMESRNNIRKHIETGSPISDAEKAALTKYYGESQRALRSNLRYLMDKGIIPKEELSDNFFARMFSPLDQKTLENLRAQGIIEDEPSLWSQMREKLVGRDFGAQDVQGIKGAGKQRAIFELERTSGKRSIIQVGKDGKVWEWTNGKARPLHPDVTKLTEDGTLKAGDKTLGGVVKQGSMEDIEAHTPYRYNKDSLAVLLSKLNESRAMVRGHQAIENLKASDFFKQSSHEVKGGVPMPEGYVQPKHLERLPGLSGYAFPARTAWIIEDFARQRNPNILTEMSGMLVKNMMLNPLPHIFNEALHLYNARGLTGWVTPAGISRFAKGFPDALRSVITQDEFYRDTAKYNGSLLAPATRVSALEQALGTKALNEFAEGGGLKEMARYFGRSVLDMYDGISKASNKAMWVIRDTMYMQYVKELMEHKNLSHEMAIKEAERHLPNYRLPETIGEGVLGAKTGRILSETLQNPNVSVFSRYHYGMLKSIMETMKDIGAVRKGAEGMAEFKEGVDTMAAIVVATAALYPLMDMVAQSLTGNPDAKQRRAGPYHLGHAISEVADGTKDPQAVLSAIFTFNPALLGLVQLGLDRNLYNGQHIYNPESAPDVIARDVGKYVFGQLPQAGQVMRAAAEPGGEGFNTMAARQADIESPSHVKALKQKMMINKLKLQAKLYDMKRRAGLK